MRARFRAAWRVALTGLAVVVAAAGSCSYSPNFADGTLRCGDSNKCPKGYTCGSGGTCFKDGGGATSNPQLDSFVGTWSFASGNLNGSCSDGFTENQPLTPADFIVITRGGAGLLLQFFCDTGWSMTLPSGTTTATVIQNQTCRRSQTDTSGVTTTLVWSAKSLTFSTTDGLVGTVSGHIAGPFTDSTNASGTCDLMFNGALTKD